MVHTEKDKKYKTVKQKKNSIFKRFEKISNITYKLWCMLLFTTDELRRNNYYAGLIKNVKHIETYGCSTIVQQHYYIPRVCLLLFQKKRSKYLSNIWTISKNYEGEFFILDFFLK